MPRQRYTFFRTIKIVTFVGVKRFVTILATLLLSVPESFAQDSTSAWPPLRHRQTTVKKQAPLQDDDMFLVRDEFGTSRVVKGGVLMEYIVDEHGDTVYVDNVPPAWVFPKGVRRDRNWRKYVRLVYNFNKIYPYVPMIGEVIARTDSTIEAQHLEKGRRREYISDIQKDILHDFAPVVRHMTTSQGKLLMRLVDREIGKTSYDIVKDYKNGVAAGFWQGVARLFGQNLKSHYDPEGEDKLTEELIQKWESGQWDAFYWSIFFEEPPRTKIPERYR